MNVTIWGINYAPEPTGIGPYNTDLCEYFAGRGHKVRMLTGFPYYPAWRKNDADRRRLFRRDNRAGVEVFRCWQYVPLRPNAWRRMLHEASFISSSFLRLLFLPRPDLLLVVSPPLLLGPAAWIASLIKRCPFHFHVQDMQPDAAISLGLLKPGLLTKTLYALERFTCKRAARVSGITRGMLQLFTRKGVPAARQYLLPNWVIPRAVAEASSTPATETFRSKHNISPTSLLVVYSGNLGRKQGLDILLDAAEKIKESGTEENISLIIAGEGAAKEELRHRIESDELPVQLLPLQPDPMFQAMLREADLCLVTQQKGAGSLFFPSKLITLLAASCPVLTVADEESELALSVKEGKFGRNILPGDPAGLAAAITDFARCRKALPQLAANGSAWIRQFSRNAVLSKFVDFTEADFGPQTERATTSLAHESE